MSSENENEQTAVSERGPDDTAPLAEAELEQTGVSTPVVVSTKRAASAKPRAASAKAKSAKADPASPAPRSRRAPAKKTGASAKRGEGGAPRSRRGPKRGEASIPPTWSDLDAQGNQVVTTDATPILAVPLPAGIAASSSEAVEPVVVPLSRPWLSPYVKAAAGLAAAICLVVIARGHFRHAPPPVQAATANLSVAAAPVEPAATEPSADTIVPPADTLAPTESAEDDKRDSLAALEQGKFGDAIAAGERSTELDPTDADAWLILGAAYMDEGNLLAARRSFGACAKQAKRGEVRECTFLLQ